MITDSLEKQYSITNSSKSIGLHFICHHSTVSQTFLVHLLLCADGHFEVVILTCMQEGTDGCMTRDQLHVQISTYRNVQPSYVAVLCFGLLIKWLQISLAFSENQFTAKFSRWTQPLPFIRWNYWSTASIKLSGTGGFLERLQKEGIDCQSNGPRVAEQSRTRTSLANCASETLTSRCW